ncbi:MAG TPA: MBL fold metallo-hydrolase [bacterium]|nr:MBL fold metallo-hydrolase [bacterium]HOL47809.1 MBL fold metallo-hydrolase [bacterium]HPQ19083.1 MBL fold metallo-hydrolase [bacterium]
MNITFLGAAKCVSGSCYLIEDDNLKFLIDCGLYQGSKELQEYNYQKFNFNPATIDYVLLTHAHIDHSGLLPKLYKEGFRGKIIATSGTIELCEILLPDSAHIQENEVKRKNKKNERAGRPLLFPIYTINDVNEVLKLFEKIEYDKELFLKDNLKVIFKNSGHILGSAYIELYYFDKEKNKRIKIIFSGDLGHEYLSIIKKPEKALIADYLILESTYGNRIHKIIDNNKKEEEIKKIIMEIISKKGKLIIPAFAVERTQDLLFTLNKLFSNNELPEIPVYIDSPLAVEATKIFCKNTHYYNNETFQFIKNDITPFDLPNFNFIKTAEESMILNDIDGPMIIISSSGMCEAGRIKHHLKHNLWKENNIVLFVGYQAEGTLGRRILDGEKIVRIHNEPVSVKAKIVNLESFSAHADRPMIISWLTNFIKFPYHIFLVHGEDIELKGLKEAIISNFSFDKIFIPEIGDKFEIINEQTVKFKENILKEKKSLKYLQYFNTYRKIKKYLKELIALRKSENAGEILEKELKEIAEKIELLLKR